MQEKEKEEADFINTLIHSDFISICTNYMYNAYIYYMSINPYRIICS